jgi:hypothetical protein
VLATDQRAPGKVASSLGSSVLAALHSHWPESPQLPARWYIHKPFYCLRFLGNDLNICAYVFALTASVV